MTNFFTLIKTPQCYGLPTAQPRDLEVMLYLNYASKLPRDILLTQDLHTKLVDFQDNKYWTNNMDAQDNKSTPTILPILHHTHAIVPSHNIIPYLKEKLYDVDNYMSNKETIEYIGYQALTTKFLAVIQYILSQDSNYPIAAGAFFPIRWSIRAQYVANMERHANTHGVYNLTDATIELAYLLAQFSVILQQNTYFGPQNKLSTLDFSVASGMAFCLFSNNLFLSELLYQFYPALIKHCHMILNTCLPEHGSDVNFERLTPSLCAQAYTNLVGTNSPTNTQTVPLLSTSYNVNTLAVDDVVETPVKKSRGNPRKTRKSVVHTPQQVTSQPEDTFNIYGDGFDDEMGADDGFLAFNDNTTPPETQEHNVSVELATVPAAPMDKDLPYITRHTIHDVSRHQIKQYATRSWISTTEYIRSLETPRSSMLAQQFLFLGAVILGMYFVVVKTKARSDANSVLAEQQEQIQGHPEYSEFHYLGSELEDKYTDFKVNDKFLE